MGLLISAGPFHFYLSCGMLDWRQLSLQEAGKGVK